MPTVFISYSHDSGHHADRVLALADRLRSDGIDVSLDQYVVDPPEGWAAWSEHRVATADFVVLVCTPTYRRRFDREEAPGVGLGVTWEATIARQLLYEAGARNVGLIPVVFDDADPRHDVPLALRAYTHYRLADGYEDLLRRITRQPRHPAPPLGPLRVLPPDPRRGPSPSPGGLHVYNDGATIGQVVNVTGNVSFAGMTIAMPTPKAAPTASPPPPPPPPATILLMTANATEPARRLELEQELRAILDALARSRQRDRFAPRISPSVTFAQVIHDLDDHDPLIAHFGGHGDRGGAIVLEGDRGHAHAVAAEHVASLFAHLRHPPMLVVFATCGSDALAAATAKHVPYAIGFRGVVEDGMLPLFSATLYERLASRPELDVPHAFTLAKLAVTASGSATASHACLFAREGAPRAVSQ